MKLVIRRKEEISECVDEVIRIDLATKEQETKTNDIKLCLYELLSNAVIHGNQEDTSKAVYLKIDFNKNDFIELITDEGSGYCRENTAFSFNFLENGRGLYLVKQIADELCYNEKTNTWLLKIRW